MMDIIRDYLLSIVAVSILCGIILQIMNNHHAKEISKLICGLVLTIMILRPFTAFDFLNYDLFNDHYEENIIDAVSEGEEIAHSAWSDIIKLETEAYILDKAADLNADIYVTVSVNKDTVPVPVAADISGSISPYARAQLEQIIEDTLGITKENQRWNG